ncbi:MAG: P-loop NTPase fold protein [Solirubrobacterales bacterium]
MSQAFDVFISYPGGSPETSEHVRRLDDLLRRDGLRPWIAERDRGRAHGTAKDWIFKALGETRAFIVCLSGRKAGHLGVFEAERAAARARRDDNYVICTVLLPGAEDDAVTALPAAFSEAPVFDFRAGFTSVAPLVPMLWRAILPERAVLLQEIVEEFQGGSRAVLITGPPGSGKTSLARIVAYLVRDEYPAGQAFITFEATRRTEGMADLVLRYFGLRSQPESLREYQRQLSRRAYFVLFDDVATPDLTELVPPFPSAALFVGRHAPQLNAPHKVFVVGPESGQDESEGEPSSTVQPGYTSDVPKGDDLLDIQGQVNALCSVIAAREVMPPLSIGLFGDWGSGKSFFIEKMRQRIEALAEATSNTESTAYCSAIHQISFNAWHYADANLWASFASHVFEGLTEAGTEPERLIEELESSQILLSRAKADREIAQKRVERAQQEEEQARNDRLEVKIELRDLRDASVESLAEEAEALPWIEEMREALHLVAGEDVSVEMMQELRSRRGAVRELGRRAWHWLAGIAILLVLAALLVLLAADSYAAAVPAVLAFLGFVRVLVGPVRWVAKAHELARTRALALKNQRDVKLKHRLEQLRLAELDAIRRQEEAQKQVEEAEQAMAEIRDGRRLFRFIEERSRADAYGKYFGVVALVRRDFERLANLIEEHADARNGLPRLQRIVLYIDDLDRCPADRVVEVLEAIHLLMASELFVVVIAVDPRWLLHSLQKRYSEEMPNDESEAVSGPQDYLEKIFQIPFALSPMGEDGYRRLLKMQFNIHYEVPMGDPRERSAGILVPASELSSSPSIQTAPRAAPDSIPLPAGIDLKPRGLIVNSYEVDFMAKLGGLIRTPRAAKRLTNLYRLLRASLSEAELEELLRFDDRTAGFCCVQLLLAIAISSPLLAAPLFREVLEKSKDRCSWWDLVDTWNPRSQERLWERVVEGMGPLRAEPLPRLATFAEWVPAVNRYSYGVTLMAMS